MGRSRIKAALFVLSAAALIAAPGAFSATPQEIYSDYADNGRLDSAYTPADLERALKNAAVQQYGKPGTGGLKPAVEEEIDSTPGGTSNGSTGDPAGGTAGGTAGGQSGGTSPVAVERRPAVHRARSQSDRGWGTRADPARRSATARRQAAVVRVASVG